MKQEDKELLLRDLCARLPYGVKVKINNINILKLGTHTRVGEYITDVTEPCKPYLFPLSSMTEEQLNDFYATIRPIIEVALDAYKYDRTEYDGERPITLNDIKTDIVAVNWMLKNHLDMNGLTEKGLAIDATGLNVYKEGIK